MYLDSHNCVLIFGVIVILAVLGVIMLLCKISDNFTNLQKIKENFSPTGWDRNCPPPKPRAVATSVADGPLTGPLDRVYNPKTGKFERVYHPFGVKSDGRDIIGTSGPGAVYKCKDKEDCPNIQVKGCRREELVPDFPDNLPLGWGGTMSGPYAGTPGCASNVNGINKMSFKNAYGETTKSSPDQRRKGPGNQMYGMCVKGSSNPFDKKPYHMVF